MGSRQTTNAFPEQSSSHESYNLNRVTETATSRRVRVTTRAQKKRQEPIEPMQDVYGLSLPSQSQNLIEPDPELQRMRRLRRTVPRAVTYKVSSSSEEDTDIESSSTRIRTSRQNKRTQERAELDEPESSTSYNNSSGPISRPNKRRAIRAEEGVSRSEQDAYPIIILPPPYRNDSPLPTILQTAESETIQDSSSYLQPFNLPTTGNNTGGVVTLPPISLPQENSAHGGITLPPIRSVLSLADRSRTPEIEVVDLSSPPSYPSNNAADPYPNNIVDLTSSPVIFSPNTHSTAVNSSYKNSNNNNHSRRCHLDSRTCRAVLRILSHCAELETCASPSPPRPFPPLPGPSEQDRSASSDGAAAALGWPPGEDGCGLGEGRNGDGRDRHGETAGSDDLDDGSQGHGKVPPDGLVNGCPGVVRAHVEHSPLVEGIGVCDVREEVFDYSRNVAYQKEQSCVDVILSGSLDDLSVDFSGLLEELGLQEGEGEGKDGPTYDGLEKEQSWKDAGSFGLGEACPRADVPDHGAGRQGRTILDGSLGNESTVVDGLPEELLREEPGLLSVQSENPHPVGESCREAQLKDCDSFRLCTDDSGLEQLDGHHKDIDMCTVQENEMEEGEILNEGEVLDFSFDMEFQIAAKSGNQLEESHLADDNAEEGNATGVLCALTVAGTSSGAGLIEEDLGKTVHESDQIVGRKELKPQKKKKSDDGTKKVKGKVKKKMDLSKENSDKQPNDKKGLEHQKKEKSDFGTKVSISENIVSGCSSLAEVSSKETTVESEEKPSSTGDVKIQQKRKRAPLTENRKEKKKLSKKRKRAETNRKLGVKRLKLEMISKPKKVVFCSFYQKGRCQKGDSCKFSHDMIPDTKSTPCTFFARGICLKGDDCPFDHQLSKYPCHTYISQGSCGRGESCLFSHKIPAREPSSMSVTRQTDSKMSGSPSLENKLSTSVINTSLNTTTSTNKSMPKDSVEQIKKQPPKMPKGICFLSFGKETTIHINEKPDDMKKCDGIQVQKQGEKIIPGKLQNANENLLITPVERLSRRTPTSMVNEVKPMRLLQDPPLLVQQNVEIKSCGSAQSLASNTTTSNGSKDSINSGSRVTDASRILEEFLFTGIH